MCGSHRRTQHPFLLRLGHRIAPADAVGVAVVAVSTPLLGVARTLQVDLRKVAQHNRPLVSRSRMEPALCPAGLLPVRSHRFVEANIP